SRPVGISCSRSWMPGATPAPTGSPRTAPAATVRPKPTACWPRMAGAGAPLREVWEMDSKKRQIIVADGTAALAATAAQRLIDRVAQSGRSAVCLTGGSSPEGLYRLLGEAPWRGQVPWDRVHWFMGDDRFVPESDALSNMGMARRLFLDKAAVPASHVHPVTAGAGRPDAAARSYEAELKAFYGRHRLDPARPLFHLVLIGLGDDGH